MDTAAAILLAMAAVATAWSSYQASRWTGEQAKTFSAANAARVESTKASDLANAQTQVDIALFMQWVDAHLHHDEEARRLLPTALPRRVRAGVPGLARAPTRSTIPRRRTPRSRCPNTCSRRSNRRQQLETTADATAETAREYVQRATNYVLAVVLFAVSLFFAGISTKLPRPRLRIVILGVGYVVFISAAVWVATFPISLSIRST